MLVDFSLFVSIPEIDLSLPLIVDDHDTKDHPTLLLGRCHLISIVLYHPLLAHAVLFPEISETNG